MRSASSLPRAQLFEFHDLSMMPRALRDTIVESLGLSMRWGRMLRGLVDPLRTFLDASGATEVLDLCAGGGGPAATLFAELRQRGGLAPRFILTDILPHEEDWSALRAALGEMLDFIREPVDATRIPASLAAGRARTVINAFHHFDPKMASSILEDAVRSSRGIFISEPFDRNPFSVRTLAPMGLAAMFANPLLARRDRLAKAFLTYLTPFALLAGTWDAVISTLRVYSEVELRAMVAPFGEAFRWTYGHHDYSPFGRGYYFYGVPKSADEPRARAALTRARS